MEANELKKLLHYAPVTGVFTWRCGSKRRAGTLMKTGYIRICINKKEWLAHRLAILYTTGVIPTTDVDHKNGVRSDNRRRNLRVVSRSVNGSNRKAANPRNKVGVLGVHRHGNKFFAQRTVNGTKKYLGLHSTVAAAAQAYKAAGEVLWKS